MVEIPLTKGQVALVDDADMPLVAGYKWCVSASGRTGRLYALASVVGSHPRRYVRMHRLLLPGAPMIDHRNGNSLDNQRENLRPCTNSQNMANVAKYRGASRFKGVCWDPRWGGRWYAGIRQHGKSVHLGCFTDEVMAAEAYNAAARERFGAYAKLNEFVDT